MSHPTLRPAPGTRDFYPEDMRQREWLFGHFRSVAERFGFESVDAPIVEYADLFTRKAGEEIVEQLYHFTLHERHLALRGEMTPSLARMVIARAGGSRLPLRWTCIPQCWRYERTARGRRREHYQWNMDVWGEPDITAEAELLAAISLLMGNLGLAPGDIKIRLNSRALLEESLRQGPLRERPETFESLCVAIDKLDKIGAAKVIDLLVDPAGEIRLTATEASAVVDMLSARDLDEATRLAPRGSSALDTLKRLFDLLAAYGIEDRCVFDASVVRGLAYYTGIVFEVVDAAGELRAICGGGRYDRLSETLGGPQIPAAGFGFGDAVITEILRDRGLLPDLPRTLDDVVFAFGDAERGAAVAVAMKLRRAGRRVELVLGETRLKRVLADANRNGASEVWLLGPDELARNVAKVKTLATGEQREETLP